MVSLVLKVGFVPALVIISLTSVNFVFGTQGESNVTLTILLNRGRDLIDNAVDVLRNETDAVVNAKYLEFPSNSTRSEIIRLFSNQTPIDVITVDQI